MKIACLTWIESVPALSNPVTQFLQAEDDDGILEGKLKNAVEGLGLGAGVEGLMRLFKGFKKAKTAANSGDTAAAKEIMDDTAAEIDDLQGNLFDDTTDPNLSGGDAGPSKVVVKGDKPPSDTSGASGLPMKQEAVVKPKPKKPVDTDALSRNLNMEMSLRRGGSMPDPDRVPEGDLYNLTWDSDVEVKTSSTLPQKAYELLVSRTRLRSLRSLQKAALRLRSTLTLILLCWTASSLVWRRTLKASRL